MNRSRFFKLCNGSIVLFILLLTSHVIAQTTDDTTMPTSKFHDEGSHRSFGPGTTALLVFFITAFLLTGFISIYLRRCRNHRFSLPRHANGTSIFRGSLSLSPGHGLDPAVVSTFPTFLYSQVRGHRIGPTALECAVCLLEFEDDHILRLLPICSHVFHPVCIDTWLALHDTCPVCRANLVPELSDLTTHVSTTLCRCDSDSNLHELNSPPAGCGIGSGSVDLIIDIIDASTPEHDQSPNQNRPLRSTPRTPKNTGNKFHRSHSTGDSFVQRGDNCERFTLRLPEDVRSQLMKRSPGSSSARVFPSVRSPREGYRSSSSIGTSRGKNYKRFHSAGRSGGWSFRMTSPFPSQTASVRSPGDDLTATPRNLKGSVKSPLDRFFRSRSDKDDDGGRRSTSRLIPDGDG